MENKKILVTGGAGLIGLEVGKQLHALGHEVRLFDLGEQILRIRKFIPDGIKIFYGSILDSGSLYQAMKGVDVVIHLAALLGVQRSENDKLRCIEINIEGTQKTLESAVKNRVEKIVFSSSSEVYGEPLENPVEESAITQGKTVYAITKLAGEELCKGYAQRYPIKYSILRFFNCYGPFQVNQFVLSKFVSNVMKGVAPEIYGDGEQTRSYTHVTDTAKATILAAFSEEANGRILNIGDGSNPVSLKDLANLVIKIGRKEGDIIPKFKNFENSDRSKEREIIVRYCNSNAARDMLLWRPLISLEQGIKDVFDNGVIFERWENLYDEQN